MCRLTFAIDQSIHTLCPVLELIEESSFQLRSIRLAPIGWSRKADVYLSLGGGSRGELDLLLERLRTMPAIGSTQSTPPPAWAHG